MYLFVIDPGTRTGVAWGSVPDKGTLMFRLSGCQISSQTIEGDPIDQAIDIETNLLYDFMYKLRSKPHEKIHIVIEDFILRKMTMDRELLDPLRVTSAFLAIVRNEYQSERYDVTLQQPSTMATITSDRLRLWNLWIKGSDPKLEHQRDARRHFAAYVAEQVRRAG